MKSLSIRTKLTLWFSMVLLLLVVLTYTVVLSVSSTVLQNTIQDGLIQTVEGNIGDVKYMSNLEDVIADTDYDLYIEYDGGYLEMDDDYLDLVNGITSALYTEEGEMLYGEDHISMAYEEYRLANGVVQEAKVDGVTYYIYDRMLEGDGLDGLWLRGVVSEAEGTAQFTDIAKISLYILPFLCILGIAGSYLVADSMLKPIQHISDTAEQITTGQDLKQRIPLSPGNDELHQLAGTINSMMERLDESFEAERQFTSDVSHELRTPMSVIQAQCEYTLEEPRTREEYEDALQVVQRQSKKMSRLIDDMLRFSRMERNSDKYSLEPLNLSDLTDALCEDMALLKHQNITLTWETAPDIFVNGNYELLSRLLSNLINNAYRYGKPDGTTQVRLEVLPSTEGTDEAVLTVRDNGIGIEKEHLDKIFRKFYQADSSRSGRGSGLGLAMVKEIAEFHGGTVSVSSAPGKGSTFTVRIPVTDEG